VLLYFGFYFSLLILFPNIPDQHFVKRLEIIDRNSKTNVERLTIDAEL